MKFKVEFQTSDGSVFKEIYFAESLMELSEKILNSHPSLKVLSIVGGGA